MKSFHFQIVFLILEKVLALMLFLDYLMVFWALTGYSLSDQHILSPFNPKYDNWICQICEDLHELFWTKLFSPELHKCYFLYNYKQIRSKVPILLYFVRPKRPSGNCYWQNSFGSEIQSLQNLCFEFQNNLCKSS